MSKISKNWEKVGNGMEELMSTLSDLEKRTVYQTISMSDTELLTVVSHNEKYWELVRHCKKDGKVKSASTNVGLKFDEDLITEIDEVGTIPLIKVGSKIFSVPMSNFALHDLADRSGSLCRAIERRGTIKSERDRFIVASLPDKIATAIIRSDGTAEKIVAFRGSKFVPIKQTETIEKIVKMLELELGTTGDVYWTVSNEITQVYCEFPEKAASVSKKYPSCSGMQPVIRITTSDIGLSSLIVEAGFRLKNSYFFRTGGSVSFEHTASYSGTKLEDALKKKVYPEFIAIPENWERLASMDLKSIDAIEEVFEFAKIEKAGIKVLAKKLKEALMVEYALIPTINAKDFIETLITAPARLSLIDGKGKEKSLSKGSIKTLENALGEALFCPFEASKAGIVSTLMPEAM